MKIAIEVIIIVAIIAFFGFLIGNHFYRKKHHLPTGECAYCGHTLTGNKLVNAYHRKYKKTPVKNSEN